MRKRMTIVVACTATLLFLGACKKAGEGPPPGSGDASLRASGSPAVKNDSPMVAPAPPPGTTCFGSCLRQYATRAVSADQNEKDCRARCQTECIEPCKQRSAMRSVSKEQIESDCNRSCGL